MKTDFFVGKRVTVMGLGLLGRGVGDVAYIAENGATEVLVTDLKSAEDLASSVAKLSGYNNVRFVLGEHRLEDFVDRDMILVAAGVPDNSQFLEHARGHNIPCYQSAALVAAISGVPIVAVTGTRGKSTVTQMIHHVLQITTGETIPLGGNIRGVSNLQLLEEIKEDSLVVMELDSWQLQGFGWMGISPQVAVFTNFMPDHLNYYRREGRTEAEVLAAYFSDKAQIFLHQDDTGVLVTTSEVFNLIKEAFPQITLGQEVVLVDSSLIPEEAHLAMPGEHNRLNAALAMGALTALGLSEEDVAEALVSFGGVEGRLQLLGTTKEGVKIYNDNNATTPQATIAALQAVANPQEKKVVLIAGGADKGLSVTDLAYAITKTCRQVFLIPGSGTDELLTYLHDNTEAVSVSVMGDLATAWREAYATIQKDDVLLFSPGFASFSQYKNEYERNDDFVSLVKESLASEDENVIE